MADTSNAARPVPYRGEVFRPRELKIFGVVAILSLIALWQVLCSVGVISPLAAPAPSEVARSLFEMVQGGTLWPNLGASLKRLALGWAAGTVGGIAVGLAVGLLTIARSVGVPLVAALFPIPKIALLPLFIVWFGIDEGSKIATIGFGVFFPTVVATYGGVDNVDRVLVRMGRAFGMPGSAILWKIVLPGALPAILSGFRISASIGIILLVAAEMIGARYGIGAMVLLSGNLMQIDQLLAGVVVLSLMGLCVSALIGLLERRLLAWR